MSDEQMRSAETRYPVDRYLVESSKKFEMVNIIDDEIWNPEPALRPEDELILRKLHDMLQSTADDLKLLSGELSKFHEPGVQVKTAPTPLDEDFNERVHIEEVVNAKFHGHRIIEKALPKLKPRNDTIDGKANKPQNSINNGAQVNAAPAKRPVINRNLGISRTRIIQINDKNEDSSRKHDSVEKLNNGKVINSAPAVAYNEFCYKYDEPKVQETSIKVLQVQDMPRISIRSELKEQKVLQMDIVPDSKETKDMNTIRSNISVVAIQHETVPKQVPTQYNRVQDSKMSVNSNTVRKVSKMSTCESSGSVNNVSSDAQAKRDTQKRIITAMRNSPKTSARDCNKKSTVSKKEAEKRSRLNLDEWKKKLNVVYGSSSTKNKANSRGVTKKSSPKKANVTKQRKALNNADYIPYSQLTLGGVRVSDIEREISDLPNKTDLPLSPILDKILSRENSFQKDSPRKHRKKDSPKILTTSDENLLQEVIDIEISVSETLSKNLRKKVNKPVVNSPKVSSESNKEEENESYVDDFEDEKSDHSGKSAKEISSDSEPEHNSIKSKSDEGGGASSDSDGASNPGPSSDARNTTYTKKSNLSFKDSVDIFEFIHSVDTQDSATQSNGANKITPKETQTSPRNDRPNIQPIHNDLWPTIDPRREVEKMFELEKDLIKKLILDEYGDLLEKNINKPSTSNENKPEESKRNVAASQKNTQTSPAHVKSVMTSPRMTKTRTTSPFHPTVPVHQQTSPMILVTNEDQRSERSGIEVEADDISVNLSSPRFKLRLPRTSREVLSNLTHSRPHSKISCRNEKLNNKTFTKTAVSSSSSLDADNSTSELSSLGEVKIKRKLRKRVPSVSEYSSSSSKYSQDVQSAGILPLRSEGELSLGQVSKKRLNKPSDGETSWTPPK